MKDRLSVCYAAPGHTLLSSAGSTRNILAAADALSEWADLTVAFRSVAESVDSRRFKLREIEPRTADIDGAKDDVAARGLNPISHLAYLRTLKRFAATTAGSFDLVFEKGWRLSGYLSGAYGRNGTPAVLIENDARRWSDPIDSPRALARYLLHRLAEHSAARFSRRLPLVVAETEQLKSALVEHRRISPERIEVVGLGVDHSLFRPRSQDEARRSFGIDKRALVMLYVGGMDQYHDLSPVLRALAEYQGDALELHLVGDGEYRDRYQALAEDLPVTVRFHGQLGHRSVPACVAAADVCLAPYDTSGFHGNQVAFSTLKIPEYMACERPVISVPSGHILTLIDDDVTGFLFENTRKAWHDFLRAPPSRERLLNMGRRAGESVANLSWETTARRYLELAERLLQGD